MATYFIPYDNSIPSETEFENFSGQDVDGWLYKIESFFDHYQVAPIQRLAVIHNYLNGEATEWHYEMYMDWRLTTWESFVRDLKIRFKPPETQHSPSQVLFTPSSVCQTEYKSEDTQESIGEEVVLTKDESDSELEVTIEAIPTAPSIVILTEVVVLQGDANRVFVASSGVLHMDLYCCNPSVCQIAPMKISLYSNMLCHLKDDQNTLCERTIGVLKLASLNKPPPLPPEIEKGYRGCSGQTSMILNHAYFLEPEINTSNDFGAIALDASGMQIQGLSLRQNLEVHQLAVLLSTHAQLESPFLGVLILTKTRVIDVSAYANKNHSLTGYSNEMNCEVYYAASLVTWLYCLARIKFIDEDSCYYVVLWTTFVQFLELMRKLHMNCCFASAASHRVGGFSEYNSISFLFQSSQLFDHKYMKLKSIHTAYISRKFAQKYMYLPYADIEMKVKKRLLTEHLSLPGCEFYLEQRQCQICITATPILGFTLQLHNRNGIAVSKPFATMIVVVKCAKGIFLNSFCFNLWLNKYEIRQCLTTFSTLIFWVEELHYAFSCMSHKLWKKQLSEWVKTLVQNGVNSESKFACEALPYTLMGMVGDLLSSSSSYKEFVTDWVLIYVAYYTMFPVQNYFDWMQLHTTPNKNKVFKQNYQHSCQFNTYLVAMNYVYFLLTNIFQRTIGTKDTDGHCASHTSTVIYNLYIMELLCEWKVWGMVVSDTHQVLARDHSLSYHSKSILYSMMRFGSVKNMADLVGYGRHQSLIELAHFSMLQLDQMKSTAGYIFILQHYLAYNVLVESEERQQKSFYVYWGILSPKKPEAWDDKPYIVDPGDKKPEYDDIPIKILDADGDKPEDWDEDENREWKPHIIAHTDYKGPWRSKQIKSFNYKWQWNASWSDNSDFLTGMKEIVEQKNSEKEVIEEASFCSNVFPAFDFEDHIAFKHLSVKRHLELRTIISVAVEAHFDLFDTKKKEHEIYDIVDMRDDPKSFGKLDYAIQIWEGLLEEEVAAPVISVRISKLLIFSSPRPPEGVDLEDKVNFKEGGMLRAQISQSLGALMQYVEVLTFGYK